MELCKGSTATLIQDIVLYLKEIVPRINRIVDKGNYAYSGITPEGVIKWLIAEEFWQAYSIHRIGHDRHQQPYVSIREALDKEMNRGLAEFTLNHIKALVMYNDHRDVALELLGRDLYIKFYGQVYNGEYNLTAWKT